MVRTQIYLTDEEKQGLAEISKAKGTSQSDLIRQAIDDMLVKMNAMDKFSAIDEIAGIWADRDDLPDIREMRNWRNRIEL